MYLYHLLVESLWCLVMILEQLQLSVIVVCKTQVLIEETSFLIATKEGYTEMSVHLRRDDSISLENCIQKCSLRKGA